MREAGSTIQAMQEGIRTFLPEYMGYGEPHEGAQSDRLLREHVNREIVQLSAALAERARKFAGGGAEEVARAIERVRKKLDVLADGLSESIAEAGAAAVESLDEETAGRLYSYDLSILRRIAELRQEIDGMNAESLVTGEDEETLTLLDDLVDGLSQDLFERDTLIEGQNELEY